ncbi:hypothetical protein GCM10010353_37170 [Streptomyces chryseus]|nr:hypothetical protein GCM10010353_37170 [Streptomyces chryseus]
MRPVQGQVGAHDATTGVAVTERLDMTGIWNYLPGLERMADEDLTGYAVEAVDGSVGSVDRQSEVPGYDHLVVDTGVWVFGRSVVIPAGLVTSIDRSARVIRVARTKEDIKQAPAFEHDQDTSSTRYLDELGAYHSPVAVR